MYHTFYKTLLHLKIAVSSKPPKTKTKINVVPQIVTNYRDNKLINQVEIFSNT